MSQRCMPHICAHLLCSLPGSLIQESMYVQGKIETCPYNESSWNYLRGLLSLPGTDKALVLEDLAVFCLKVSSTVQSCLL